MSSAKVYLDFEALNLQDITASLKNLSKEADKVDLSKDLQKQVNALTSTVQNLKKELSSLKNSDLDNKSINKFQTDILKTVSDLNSRVTKLETEFNKLGSGENLSGLKNEFKNVKTSIDNVSTSATNAANAIQGISNAVTELDASDLKEILNILNQINSIADTEGDFIKVKSVDDAVSKLKQSYKEYQEIMEKILNIDQSNMSVSTEKDLQNLNKQLTQSIVNFQNLISTITELSGADNAYKLFDTTKINGESLTSLSEALAEELENIRTDTAKRVSEINTQLQDIGSTSKVVTQSIDDVRITNKGIPVPVYIKTKSSTLSAEYEKIISSVRSYAQKNPIQAEIMLVSSYKSRKNNEILQQISEQLNNVDDTEIRGNLSQLISDIQQQFDRELRLDISTNVKETSEEIRNTIKEMQTELKDANLFFDTSSLENEESTFSEIYNSISEINSTLNTTNHNLAQIFTLLLQVENIVNGIKGKDSSNIISFSEEDKNEIISFLNQVYSQQEKITNDSQFGIVTAGLNSINDNLGLLLNNLLEIRSINDSIDFGYSDNDLVFETDAVTGIEPSENNELNSEKELLGEVNELIATKNSLFEEELNIISETFPQEIDKITELKDSLNNVVEVFKNLDSQNINNLKQFISYLSNSKSEEKINKLASNLEILKRSLDGLEIKNVSSLEYLNNIISKSKELNQAAKNIQNVNTTIQTSNSSKSNKSAIKDELSNLNEYIALRKKYNISKASNITAINDNNDLSSEISRLQSLKNTYDNLFSSIQNKKISNEDLIKFDDSFSKKIIGEITSIQNGLSKINTDNFTKNIGVQKNELISSISQIDKALNNGDYEQVLVLLNKLSNSYNKLITDSKNLSNQLADTTSIEKLRSKIAQLLNTEGLTEEFASRLKALLSQLESAGNNINKVDFKRFATQFQTIKADFEVAGEAAESFLGKISDRIVHNTVNTIAMAFDLQQIITRLREVGEYVLEINSALTELKKVSDATGTQLNTSLETATKNAKELGSSISDMIEMQSDWARLGYSVEDAADLAKETQLLVNVGDNLDSESASEYLISTLKGFNLAADEAESIIDKYNSVANSFAIDTEGIGEALERSAASFNASNTDLSESIALVTAANETVQDADTVGTTMKTLSARIRGKDVPIYNENYSLCA